MAVSSVMTNEFGEQLKVYVKLVSAEVNNVGESFSYGTFRGYYSKEASNSGASHYFEKMIKTRVNVKQNPWEQLYLAFMEKHGGEPS